MEDVLNIYELPYNPEAPVVCMDEKPYQLYLCNAYTHGMENYEHLGFQMVLNPPPEHIAYLLNALRKRVQNGKVFRDGDMVSGLYEAYDIRLKKSGETGRDVLRLIIPDKYNRFPEDKNCMAPYKYQELSMSEE